MKKQFTDFNRLVEEIKVCENVTPSGMQFENTEALLLGVVSSLCHASEIDNANERAKYIGEGALRIFSLMSKRGITIDMMDNQVISMAPEIFTIGYEEDFKAYIYDLVCSLTYKRREDCEVLEVLKLWEQGQRDKQTLELLTEALGPAEDDDNADMWTVRVFENAMLNRKLCCVLSSLASYLRATTNHDLSWHVRMCLHRAHLN